MPAASLLGELGAGHRLALNILNLGRLKLAAACVGQARAALDAFSRALTAFSRFIARHAAEAGRIAVSLNGSEAEGWRAWAFTMRALCSDLSADLRVVMDRAQVTERVVRNAALTANEQNWSRQLYYILSLTLTGEAQRGLQNVTEGEGA